jgi:hypothetical protein
MADDTGPRVDARVEIDAGPIRMLDAAREDAPPVCTATRLDCNAEPADGCEADTLSDARHCGACDSPCGSGLECDGGECARSAASDGRDGVFAPTEDTVLAPGVYRYTTITVARGVRVTTTGTGVLDLRATGDVLVEGTIDVSGGSGVDAGRHPYALSSFELLHPPVSCNELFGGAGGDTGRDGHGATLLDVGLRAAGVPRAPFTIITRVDESGTGGLGRAGSMRTLDGASPALVSAAAFGGGRGGHLCVPSSGSPGGGFAGGCSPGGLAPIEQGTVACVDARTHAPGAYAGSAPSGAFAGGAGTIGPLAWSDLSMRTTFRPGSGGGGGGAATAFTGAGGGGGGGGGALRVRTEGVLRLGVEGAILANGGAGGAGGHCAGGGGGGSGGAIHLVASRLEVPTGARIEARGGARGAFTSDVGVCGSRVDSADGGLGRIRLDVAECAISGVLAPALASGCEATPGAGMLERVYVGGGAEAPELAASCAELFARDATLPDAVYALDVDREGPLGPIAAHCLMSDGGWTLIMASGALGPDDQRAETVVRPSSRTYLPLAYVQALAAISHEVRIRTASDPTRMITSVPDTLAIENLRMGLVLNAGSPLDAASDDASPLWTGPFALDASRLWHTCEQPPATMTASAYPDVFHAGCNSGGLHLRAHQSTWAVASPNEALEVLVR